MMLAGLVVLLIASFQLLAVHGLDPYEWVSFIPTKNEIPENAIVAGHDVDGDVMYISQMRIDKDKIPSQLILSKSVSYSVYNGDIYKSQFTAVPTPILCGTNTAWVEASLGNFPKNAIPCGRTANGDTTYVARADYNGSIIFGAVGPTSSALYAVFNGMDVRWFGTYKVLVYTDVDQWKSLESFEGFPKDAVLAGFDRTKHELYVGIIRIGNQIIPAQIDPDTMVATASYHGGIAQSEDFQVLTGGHYKWEAVKKGKIPTNVLIAGRTNEGEAMYVGRVIYKKLLIPGTILSSEHILYINYLGKLRTVENGYEVLVHGSANQPEI